ncbi:MAG: biopolymer transporter ExbD [Gammaproteobacteria bacterium]|nr:biopolymer transporter ExbD [Gammaproteobacteria bacterium]
MRRHQRRAQRRKEAEELNITAFMNLMVVLVPFLLITAVFSRITILELNLPSKTAAAEHAKEWVLQLVVRPNNLTVIGQNQQIIKQLRWSDEKVLQRLSGVLQQVKSRYPEKKSVSILLAESVSYERLVALMDRVRAAEVVQVGGSVMLELFPHISLGDAPLAGMGR